MKYYQISIESKNQKSLENFLTFFSENIKKYNSLDKNLKKNKKRKILSILKSPHVYKTAQDQFQSYNYSKNINLYLTQNSIALLFIKKISLNVFLDVKIEIKFPINNNLSKKTNIKIFNPSNFKLNILDNKTYFNKTKRQKFKNENDLIKSNNKEIKSKKIKKVSQLLQLLDIYGEFTNKY